MKIITLLTALLLAPLVRAETNAVYLAVDFSNLAAGCNSTNYLTLTNKVGTNVVSLVGIGSWCIGYKREAVVDNVPYQLFYWGTNYNEPRILGMHMPAVFYARVEVHRLDTKEKIGETNAWFDERGVDDVAIVRKLLPKPTVEWLGSPVTGEALGGGPGRGLLDMQQKGEVILGLRSDGTVVWKRREK